MGIYVEEAQLLLEGEEDAVTQIRHETKVVSLTSSQTAHIPHIFIALHSFT